MSIENASNPLISETPSVAQDCPRRRDFMSGNLPSDYKMAALAKDVAGEVWNPFELCIEFRDAVRLADRHNSCVSRLQDRIKRAAEAHEGLMSISKSLLARTEEAEAKLKLHEQFLEGPLNSLPHLSPEDIREPPK